jgi:hypothetical protein
MNSQQLGQQPIFIWMCYGIFETDLYAETFFCRQKSVSPLTATLYNLLAGSASQTPVRIRLISTP